MTVHSKQLTEEVRETSPVQLTVRYVIADGSPAPREVSQTMTIERTGTRDLAAGAVSWHPGGGQTFAAVPSPPLVGYTPDKPVVTGITVDYGARPIIETVTYVANEQRAVLTIVDDTTGTVLQTEVARGQFGQPIHFSNLPTWLKGLQSRGYCLVANDFHQRDYHHNDDQNRFTIHLAHRKLDVSDTDPGARREVTRQIVVVNPLSGQATSTKQRALVTRTAIKDVVTDTVAYGDWWARQSWPGFAVAPVPGYQPSQEMVPGQEVTVTTADETVMITYRAVARPRVTPEPRADQLPAPHQQDARERQRGLALASLSLMGLITAILGRKRKQK